MTVTMEEIRQAVREETAPHAERIARLEVGAVERHERVLDRLANQDEKLEAITHAIHGNGQPGLHRRLMNLEEWRIRIEGMKAGGVLVLSSIGAMVGFLVSGGLRVLASWLHIGGSDK